MKNPTREYLLPGLWSFANNGGDPNADLEVSDDMGIVLVHSGGKETLVAPDEMSNYKMLFAPRLSKIYDKKGK